MKEVKPIKFNYDGIDYTLEYSKGSLRNMKDDGFDSSVLSDKDSTPEDKLMMTSLLWRGAFYKNHRTTKVNVIDEIYEKMPNKTDLIERLASLYAEPFKALTAEPEEGEAVRWE